MSKSKDNKLNARPKGAPVPVCDCGMAMAAEFLGDRWTLLIIRESFYGVGRFGVIKDDLGIPKAALSDRLAKLVVSGILAKTPYRNSGHRTYFEYVLTAKGQELFPILIALMQWGEKYLKQSTSPRISFFNRHTNTELRAAVVDQEGNELVDPRDVRLRIG